jgi:hypothetical protein
LCSKRFQGVAKTGKGGLRLCPIRKARLVRIFTGYAISKSSIVYAQIDFKGLQRAVCGWVGVGRLGLCGC